MGGRIRSICNDPEIISLGERAHQAFPECPVIGVDIIRESSTGRLHVLEVNPHGAVWHLSSPLAKKMDRKHVRELYAQFNALDLAADLLIQKTRAEAC
jgi:D-alanine-D-alanine ligase-like ATP-grasp enzyme